jgi:predicted nicotinamide N-methyase
LGIALSKLHAHSIITDLASLLPLLKQNVELNKASAEVAELCWGETDCTLFTKKHHIDYIIASDCIYLEHLFQPLLQTIEQLSAADTVTVVSFIKRRKADSKFWKLATKRFNISIVSSLYIYLFSH